jgi:hypothetical protein
MIQDEKKSFTLGDDNLSSGKLYYWKHKDKIKDCVYRYRWQHPDKVAEWRHKSYMKWRERQEEIRAAEGNNPGKDLPTTIIDNDTFCKNNRMLCRVYNQLKKGVDIDERTGKPKREVIYK